jgi:hypothetical protein
MQKDCNHIEHKMSLTSFKPSPALFYTNLLFLGSVSSIVCLGPSNIPKTGAWSDENQVS